MVSVGRMCYGNGLVLFFKQKTAYEMRISDWSSDVCSSDLVRDLAPDLAILDIKMPGIDGLEAAREITADRKAAVLILTAFSQRDLIEQARDAGALAYLVKPFQRSELIPAVEIALGRHRAMRALHDQTQSLEEIGRAHV